MKCEEKKKLDSQFDGLLQKYLDFHTEKGGCATLEGRLLHSFALRIT